MLHLAREELWPANVVIIVFVLKKTYIFFESDGTQDSKTSNEKEKKIKSCITRWGWNGGEQASTSSLVWNFKVLTPTTTKTTGSYVVHHRLQDEIQMEVDRHHQNEEQPDFQMTQRVMASTTRRSNVKRILNQGFFVRDEIEEHGQQGNEQPSLEFTQEVENALKILMAPSTLRAITNLNSLSHQASVMASRTWKATTNQSGHNILRDEDQVERDKQHQNEEQPEFLTTQQTKDQQDMDRCVRRAISIDESQYKENMRAYRISREITSTFHRFLNVTSFTWKLTSQKQKDEYYQEFRNAFSRSSDWEHETTRMLSLSVEERSIRKAAERGILVMDCVYDSFHDIHVFKDGRYTYKRAADVDARVLEIAANGVRMQI
ncbi:hypothetical protein AAHA92_16706 [Salvia divinorum]|uniref:Uncharacterized protein n=1 Tax=Salvia divinorum TaxID=28513 RepID=A0ABD1GZC1_SALDI